MNIYLAGPFFNLEQVSVLEQIEKACKEIGIGVFSPRLECLCLPDAPLEKRQEAFYSNTDGIDSCSFVLARIDDFDPGTVWEIGYSYGTEVPVYAFTTVPGRGLNLMLSQSCEGFLQGIPSVLKFLKEMYENGNDGEAKLWEANIQ